MNTDPDVQAYVAAIRTANLNIPAVEVDALAEFVSAAKANGYWNSLLEVYPFCGSSMAAMQYKLKYISTLSRTLAWTNGDGSSDTLCTSRGGMTSNSQASIGTTGLSTGVIPATHMAATYSIGVAFQLLNASQSYEIGNYNTADSSGIVIVPGSGFVQASLSTNGAFDIVYASSDLSGFYIGNRVAASGASSSILYRNGTQVAAAGVAVTTAPNNVMHVMGRKVDAGTGQLTRNRQHFAFIGNLLTVAQVTAMSADVAVLLRALRRTTS